MAYAVSVTVDPRITDRNRLTTAFRLILAIPHAILVGPFSWSRTGGEGLLGIAAFVMAIFSWFTILITGQHIRGIRDFTLFYLRWRTKALAYVALFVDEYPPFGDGAYPAAITIADPALPRDRASVAFRLILAIPHFFVLFFLGIGWFFTSVFAWFAILFTGSYPPSVLPFGIGVMRWMLRLEVYLLLLVDEYPPFSLQVED